MTQKFNALGAHIYAGGFTVGVRKHFNVVGHLEHDGYGQKVVQLNYPQLPVYTGGPANWPKTWPKGDDRIRFVYANPPCAIWSAASAGREVEWYDDPRLELHRDIFNLLGEVHPDVMAMESVTNMWAKGQEHVERLAAEADKLGFSTTVVMHDAQWLNVAQTRKRMFVVFHRVEIPWQLPTFKPPQTVRQLFSKLKPSTQGYDPTLWKRFDKWAKLAQPGERLARVFDRHNPEPELNERGHKIGRPGFLYYRLPWDKPANALLGYTCLHPDEHRFLTQQEAAAICSFPASYKWPEGTFSEITNYMARGVMPKVGEWLAKNVAAALEQDKRTNASSFEMLDIRKPQVERYDVHAAKGVPWDD